MAKKQNSYQLMTPPAAQLYALSEPDEEGILDRFRAFFSGVKYIFILTLMLWWLPVIGQCVAGYIGGRRAGSSYRGFMAAMVPVLLFMGISFLINGEPIPQGNPITAIAGQAAPSVSSALPFLIPYLNFSALYLGDFVESLHQTALLEVTMYTVVIIFAFIGGLMADQTKKEFRDILKAVSPINIRDDKEVWTKYYSGYEGPSFDSFEQVGASTGKKTTKGTSAKKSTGKKTTKAASKSSKSSAAKNTGKKTSPASGSKVSTKKAAKSNW